jgi:hypothetical protein
MRTAQSEGMRWMSVRLFECLIYETTERISTTFGTARLC